MRRRALHRGSASVRGNRSAARQVGNSLTVPPPSMPNWHARDREGREGPQGTPAAARNARGREGREGREGLNPHRQRLGRDRGPRTSTAGGPTMELPAGWPESGEGCRPRLPEDSPNQARGRSLEVSRSTLGAVPVARCRRSLGVDASFRVSRPAVAAHWFAAPVTTSHLSMRPSPCSRRALPGSDLDPDAPLLDFISPSKLLAQPTHTPSTSGRDRTSRRGFLPRSLWALQRSGREHPLEPDSRRARPRPCLSRCVPPSPF